MAKRQSMIRKTSLALIALLPMMAVAQESSLVFRSTISAGSSEYQFDAVSDKPGMPVHLRIVCKVGCSGFSDYSEDVADGPLYFMQPKDGVDRVLSAWVTGSAYRIVVYRLDRAGVHKILDRGSRTPPEISFDARWNEAVKLCTSKCSIYQWSDDKHAYTEK